MAISSDQFRNALSRWASGVTIITTRSGDRVHGMTVSDFSGTSLTPPLVCVCAANDSVTTHLIAEGQCFAVNVLAAHQEALSNRFASKEHEFERFDGLETFAGPTGAPMIPEALVNLDCTLVATHEAGDHVIYVGEIQAAEVRDGAPLLFYRGGYGELGG